MVNSVFRQQYLVNALCDYDALNIPMKLIFFLQNHVNFVSTTNTNGVTAS